MYDDADFCLSSYDYPLPEERIAQSPAQRRDGARLLLLDKEDGAVELSEFQTLAEHIPDDTLLVMNNSKVFPARIFGVSDTGKNVEFLILTPYPHIKATPAGQDKHTAVIQGLLKGAKRFKPGDILVFNDALSGEVLQKHDFGRTDIRITWRGDLLALLHELGSLPLPPYIKRSCEAEDLERYQTVFCDNGQAGSIAAPTAGLHFTQETLASLAARGVEKAEVTLYVGYGTFSPIRTEDIRSHVMHEEYVEVSTETVEKIQQAKAQGRPVCMVGTTSVRTLEGVVHQCGALQEFKGWVNIYIYPGFEFRVTDMLLTNFHLPKSSLLVMVSALVGREKILHAYEQALNADFRVFSYGDAMLIR